MNPDSENFDQLRKLLALKRHEMPPPGYFHGFSREVIVRIKAGELGQEVGLAWWNLEGSWLRRFWGLFETRPVLAGGFGLAVCGFFVAGALISADNPDVSSVGLTEASASIPTVARMVRSVEGTPLQRTSEAFPSIGVPNSVQDSLFEKVGMAGLQPRLQPVSFPLTAPSGN